MLITRRYEIDMGHCLPDHQGKCFRPHGHRYRIEASIVAPSLIDDGPERGMVRDFGAIKAAMAEALDFYDHRFVMCEDDPRVTAAKATFGDGVIVVGYPPTVEFLTVVWAGDLAPFMELAALRVYETPNCWAVWSCVSTASTTD